MLKIRLEKKVPSPEGPEDFDARNARDSELKNTVVKNFKNTFDKKKTITKKGPESRGSRGFLRSEPSGLGTIKRSWKYF